MLDDVGVSTVCDLTDKVAKREADGTAGDVEADGVSAYLVDIGFAETHAAQIAEEVIKVVSDSKRMEKVREDGGEMFVMDTFVMDTLDGMADFVEAFEDSADEAKETKLTLKEKRPMAPKLSFPARPKEKEPGATVAAPEPVAVPEPVAASPSSVAQTTVRTRSAGGFYDPAFLRAVAPLYDLHMGAENLGPMLYSLVRFTKPARVLEVGAGYTSMFILQALADNAAELEAYRELRAAGICACGDVPWSVDAFFLGGESAGRYRGDGRVGRAHEKTPPGEKVEPEPFTEDARVATGVLHCIDNMAHEHTTAHIVTAAADDLGLSDRLRLHEEDAFDPDLPSTLAPGTEFDLLWIDLGAANRIEGFFEAWWPRVRSEGGMVMVHSTLTNTLSRGWVERMRERSRGPERGEPPYGPFDTMSLLEPHKMFQNSVTLFQKRGGPFDRYDEPIHTKFP